MENFEPINLSEDTTQETPKETGKSFTLDDLITESKPISFDTPQPEFESNETSDFQPLNEEPKKKRGRKPKEQTQTMATSFAINGAILLLCVDLILPFVFTYAHNLFVKKEQQVNMEDIKLTTEQKNDLAPLADEAAKMIQLTNPLAVFSIVMVINYSVNLMTVKALK